MRLRVAIERLPMQQQVAVTLRHLEGLGYPEIAEMMDIAESTVRFHVREARLALARMLGEA
jgi:RNA polymerase sigma-70 factor (ECF subfamily)